MVVDATTVTLRTDPHRRRRRGDTTPTSFESLPLPGVTNETVNVVDYELSENQGPPGSKVCVRYQHASTPDGDSLAEDRSKPSRNGCDMTRISSCLRTVHAKFRMHEVSRINSTMCDPLNSGLVTSVRNWKKLMHRMSSQMHQNRPTRHSGDVETEVQAFRQKVHSMAKSSTYVAPADECDAALCFSTSDLFKLCEPTVRPRKETIPPPGEEDYCEGESEGDDEEEEDGEDDYQGDEGEEDYQEGDATPKPSCKGVEPPNCARYVAARNGSCSSRRRARFVERNCRESCGYCTPAASTTR